MEADLLSAFQYGTVTAHRHGSHCCHRHLNHIGNHDQVFILVLRCGLSCTGLLRGKPWSLFTCEKLRTVFHFLSLLFSMAWCFSLDPMHRITGLQERKKEKQVAFCDAPQITSRNKQELSKNLNASTNTPPAFSRLGRSILVRLCSSIVLHWCIAQALLRPCMYSATGVHA